MRPKTIAAVMTTNQAGALFDEIDKRIPDQRPIGKEPDITTIAARGKHRLDGSAILFGGAQPDAGEGRIGVRSEPNR